jgi:shikimate kinase
MRIKEIIEGRYDPYTGKAIFFAGGAGSGKTFIARKLASVFYGLKQVNPDVAFKYLLKKTNLSIKMPPEEEYFRDRMRNWSKRVAGKTQQIYQREKLGMLIDTTGRSYPTIENLKKELEADDYNTAMIFVNTDLATALKRNRNRQRTVPEKIIYNNWNVINQNAGKYQRLFGNNFFTINNSEKNQSTIDQNIVELEKKIKNFLD